MQHWLVECHWCSHRQTCSIRFNPENKEVGTSMSIGYWAHWQCHHYAISLHSLWHCIPITASLDWYLLLVLLHNIFVNITDNNFFRSTRCSKHCAEHIDVFELLLLNQSRSCAYFCPNPSHRILLTETSLLLKLNVQISQCDVAEEHYDYIGCIDRLVIQLKPSFLTRCYIWLRW